MNHPGGLQLTSRAARLAGLSPGMTLLDIGCGEGASLEHLSRKLGVVPYGIDISNAVISVSRERIPQAVLVTGSADALPFSDAEFDAAICECVLSLIEDTTKALSETHRVLKPNGAFIVSDVCDRDDIGKIKKSLMLVGFEVEHFEDHKQALVTYMAEICNACVDGNSPYGAKGHTVRTDELYSPANTTYYLMICRKKATNAG